MPIIINEIEISVSVSDREEVAQSQVGHNSSKREIIKACVEQVMDLIKQKNER
ncbi:hypothetical protein ACVWYG_000080 [Pedobacter sp. UYEF25]